MNKDLDRALWSVQYGLIAFAILVTGTGSMKAGLVGYFCAVIVSLLDAVVE